MAMMMVAISTQSHTLAIYNPGQSHKPVDIANINHTHTRMREHTHTQRAMDTPICLGVKINS